MATDMEWALQADLHKDVRFKLRSQDSTPHDASEISAHKCVLVARCAYFRSLFTGGMVESRANVIVEDSDVLPFRLVIRFLYTLSLDLEAVVDCIFDVYKLACKFDIEKLRSQVESILAYNLSVENSVSIFSLAESYQSEGLKRVSARFIALHEKEVSKLPEYGDAKEAIDACLQSRSTN